MVTDCKVSYLLPRLRPRPLLFGSADRGVAAVWATATRRGTAVPVARSQTVISVGDPGSTDRLTTMMASVGDVEDCVAVGRRPCNIKSKWAVEKHAD